MSHADATATAVVAPQATHTAWQLPSSGALVLTRLCVQALSLIWTLLQGGHSSLGGDPVARRAIICCPTSLVSNWDSEANKWLKAGPLAPARLAWWAARKHCSLAHCAAC